MWEWDGPKATELSGMGAARKPGATLTFQDLDGTVEVIMTDGKPTGWKGSGNFKVTIMTADLSPPMMKGVYGDRKLGVFERKEGRMDRQVDRAVSP
jgi:hypothetical protein